MSRFRRWAHLMRHLLNHRAVTAYRGLHGPPTLIACDCGRIFWVDPSIQKTDAEAFIREFFGAA